MPANTTGDIRVGIEFGRAYELSMIGANLFVPSHIEFGPTGTAKFVRSYYSRLTWRP